MIESKGINGRRNLKEVYFLPANTNESIWRLGGHDKTTYYQASFSFSPFRQKTAASVLHHYLGSQGEMEKSL